jgi:hypothetical protein
MRRYLSQDREAEENIRIDEKQGVDHAGTLLFLSSSIQLLAVLRIRIQIPIQIHRIHMFLGLSDPDPDPLFRGMDPDPAPDPSTTMQKLYTVNFDLETLKYDLLF